MKPEGALYAFPRLDPEVYDIEDDEQLVLDLLLQEKILVTQGTGFNWPAPDHLRIVTLPVGPRSGRRDRAAGQLPGQLSTVTASTVERVTHSHSHSSSSGPSPLGPLPARIVVGLLVAIGVAVLAGAVVLWPSRQRVDIPMPFQNAAGGAVSTQGGHVLSSALGDCGSPSASQVLTTAPVPAAPGAGRCVQTLVAIDSGPNAGAKTLLEFSPGPGQPQFAPGRPTSGSPGRSTTRAPPATRSTTSNAAGRWSDWPSRSRW